MRPRHLIIAAVTVAAVAATISLFAFRSRTTYSTPALEPTPIPTPGPPVPLRSFALHDVQGIFGGQALWVTPDRTAIVQLIGPPPVMRIGLWEKRRRYQLTEQQWGEVERLVGTHRVLDLSIPDRAGKPDEAYSVIRVETTTGQTQTVGKWARDKNPAFDPLYQFLLQLCRSADRGEPIHEGPYEWDWRPDGFAAKW